MNSKDRSRRMIFNRSTQYILQALIHLVSHPSEQPVLARDLAAQLGLPAAYLAKLLQQPCRAGWLSSSRGRGGGFILNPAIHKVTLLDVLTLTGGEHLDRECLLGFKTCDDATACVMHGQWKPIKRQILEQFGGYTLARLAASRKRLPAWLSATQPISRP